MNTRIRVYCESCGKRSILVKKMEGLHEHLKPGNKINCPKCSYENAKIKCVTFK